MAKIDLSNAFRSVAILPTNHTALGLHWTFKGDQRPTYSVDTRLPFGASLSPEVFNDLSQAVVRIMGSKGYHSIIAYLDDFLVVGDSYADCNNKMTALLQLLRRLGFSINYSKVEGPKQCITFLGIVLDSVSMTLKLSEKRINDLLQDITYIYSKTKVSNAN